MGGYEAAEALARGAVRWLELAAEGIGAALIALGMAAALVRLATHLRGRHAGGTVGVRLALAQHLALALEFLLAADLLATAIAPTWDRIGKLAAVAAIRTALNVFLMREMREEEAAGRNPRRPPFGATPPAPEDAPQTGGGPSGR